jgi:hypothetical protein
MGSQSWNPVNLEFKTTAASRSLVIASRQEPRMPNGKTTEELNNDLRKIFKIKLDKTTFMETEPIVGKWYCGFDYCYDEENDEYFESGGALGKYVGDGEFEDEEGYPVGLGAYDFIVEQV